jgi:DNA end-binding protein Ku
MRSVWSGALSFGLINIPVKLYTASEERSLKFKLVDKKDMCPISYVKVCRNDDREVPSEDIAHAYEIEEDHFVVLEDEDFRKANVKKSETIELISFAVESEIDPRYYEKPYFIEPDPKAAKAYALFRDALAKSGLVGIGSYVFRQREYFGAIAVSDNALVLNQLRFEQELRKPDELKIPGKVKYAQKELDMAIELIKELQAPFEPEQFKDTYTEDLLKLIRSKAKGKKPVQKGKEPKMDTDDLIDIMDMLKRSLELERDGDRARGREPERNGRRARAV